MNNLLYEKMLNLLHESGISYNARENHEGIYYVGFRTQTPWGATYSFTTIIRGSHIRLTLHDLSIGENATFSFNKFNEECLLGKIYTDQETGSVDFSSGFPLEYLFLNPESFIHWINSLAFTGKLLNEGRSVDNQLFPVVPNQLIHYISFWLEESGVGFEMTNEFETSIQFILPIEQGAGSSIRLKLYNIEERWLIMESWSVGEQEYVENQIELILKKNYQLDFGSIIKFHNIHQLGYRTALPIIWLKMEKPDLFRLIERHAVVLNSLRKG